MSCAHSLSIIFHHGVVHAYERRDCPRTPQWRLTDGAISTSNAGAIDTPAPRRTPHLRNRSRKTSTRSAHGLGSPTLPITYDDPKPGKEVMFSSAPKVSELQTALRAE